MTFCHYPKFTIIQADQLFLVKADVHWVISKGAILDNLLHKSGAIMDTVIFNFRMPKISGSVDKR